MSAENDSHGEGCGSADANRREFLRRSAGAVVGASLVGVGGAGRTSPAVGVETSQPPAGESPKASAAIPPHDALLLPGVHGYAQRSLAAGETLRVRMSADVPYRMSIRRLGVRVDDRESDEVLQSINVAKPRVQTIHPGSYVHVERGLSSEEHLGALSSDGLDMLSLECWLRPWTFERRQGVITQLDDKEPGGIGLLITEKGELAFHCGIDATTKMACILTAPFPKGREWRHLVATWDGQLARLCIDGQRVASAAFDAVVKPPQCPIRLGASGSEGRATQFLDGDLAVPAIYFAVLADDIIALQFKQRGSSSPVPGPRLAAFWPLFEEQGAYVQDDANDKHPGEIINRGTWMIGGPKFDAAAVPRYRDPSNFAKTIGTGSVTYDPDADPQRGHGLRLASDDLYDCRWEVNHEFVIPADAAPGIYVAEAEFERKGKTYRYPITFVVRQAASKPLAEMLVLCATSTWTAYSSTSFAVNTAGPQSWGTNGIKNSNDAAPAYSCYRNHRAGQPTYQIGLNMPWPAAGPDVRYSPPEVGYSHLMRAERYLQAWLQTEGYDFDVASDLDLHREPSLLEGRKVVIVNGHSEYWSRDAYEAVDAYLKRGGSLVVLSGNTMFWRTSFDDEVMECRKFDDHIGGRPNAMVGELFHTHDHRRGSLMRECGLPSGRVIGLEAAGWGAIDRIEGFAPFTVTDADHPLLTTPTPTNLRKGDTFGQAAGGGGPRAVGHEWDVRVSQLARMTGPLPDGAELPAEPAGIRTLAQGILERPTALDYLGRATKLVDGVAAEFIDWQRPEGGRVINFGSIGVGWALATDPVLQTIMRNALHACGAVRPA